MASPWEKYATAAPSPTPQSGPWAAYTAATLAPTPPGGTPAPAAPESVSVPTGDWRTQSVEYTLPGGRRGRVTSPSDAAMLTDSGKHGFSLAGRNLSEALGGILQLPNLLNYVLPKRERTTEDVIADRPAAPRINIPNVGAKLADALGADTAQNDFEKSVSAVQQGATAAVTPLGAGKLLQNVPRLAKVGEFLSAGPKLQIAGGATGNLAAEETRQAGGGEGAKLAAALICGLTPFAAPKTFNSIRSILQGGERGAATMRDNIAAFESATGVTPSYGQARAAAGPRVIESTLARLPGSNTVMMDAAEKLTDKFGNAVGKIAESASPAPSMSKAGTAIREGYQNSFVPDARAHQAKLYSALDAKINPTTEVDASNYVAELNRITQTNPAAEATLKELIDPVSERLKAAAAKDMGGTPPTPSPILGADGKPIMNPGTPPKSTLPYSALQDVRSKIGEKIANYKIGDSGDINDYRALYGALSEDMKGAAAKADASAEFDAANAFTKGLHDTFDTMNTVVNKNGGPSNVFKAVMSSAKDDHEIVKTVVGSIPAPARKEFAAAVVNRLGRAVSSAQNNLGDEFSIQTFLTNWDKISPESRQVIFGSVGKDFAKDMDTLAKVAANVRKGSEVFKNPSGTAGAAANANFAFTAASAAAGGAGKLLFSLLGGAAISRVTAKALTNPRIVKWIAQSSKKPIGALPTAINQLGVQSERLNDPDGQALADWLKGEIVDLPQK